MELLTVAAVILVIAYRCIIGALFATGTVLIVISIGWGIYDRIQGGTMLKRKFRMIQLNYYVFWMGFHEKRFRKNLDKWNKAWKRGVDLNDATRVL